MVGQKPGLEQSEQGKEWKEMRSEKLQGSTPYRALQDMLKNVNFILSIVKVLVVCKWKSDMTSSVCCTCH